MGGDSRYAVAAKNKETIIEHLSRKLSQVCSLFLQWGSIVTSVSVEREHVQWSGVQYAS